MADFATKSLLLAGGVAADTCLAASVVLRVSGGGVKYLENIPASVSAGAIGAVELASSGVALGTYGDAVNIPQVTIDADGRVTAATNIAVSIPPSGVSADAGQQLTLGTDSKPLAMGLATAAALAAEVTALTAADIASGAVAGNTLTLTLKGGGTVTVDVTSLAADIHVVSGSYNAGTGNIDFVTSTTPLNDFSVPASALLPVSVNHSIIGNGSTTPLSLVSDQATPAGSLAYGTSAAGAKGWVDVNALLDPTNNGVPATGTYVLGYINGVGPQLVPVV
jgi:hypothetical protein